MNAEILRAVEVAGQALAAARAAVQWGDSAFASTSHREFLAMMATQEARRARAGARYLVTLVESYRNGGDLEMANEVAQVAQQVEGLAFNAEEQAKKAIAIAESAREIESRIASRRATAQRFELLREHTDRTDVVDVFVTPTGEIFESVLRETRWPSGRVSGRLLWHPTELSIAEKDEIAKRVVANKWEVTP